MTYLSLSFKMMVTLIIVTYAGVWLGNFIWDRDIKRMPTGFKLGLGLIALLMIVSILNFVLALVWSIP